MGDGALVEAVDLDLQPVEAELAEHQALEGARDLVAELAAAKARIDREPAALDDAMTLVHDTVRGAADAFAVRLADEPPERVRLALRALDVGDDLVQRARRPAEELARVLAGDELEQELGVGAVSAPELDGHAATLPEPLRCRARRPHR